MKTSIRFGITTMLAACTLIGIGCASMPPTEPVRVGGLVFHNNAMKPLNNVRLQVPKTGGFISCNLILPLKTCATTFPSRNYRGTPVIITWQRAGEQFSSGKIRIQSRKKTEPGKTTTVFVTFNIDGSVEAKVE